MSSNISFINENWDWKTTLISFIENKNYPTEWKDFFENEKVKKEISKISNLINDCVLNNVIVYPNIDCVFNTFKINIKDIKVVLLGQDPYHDGNAVGLCFSVPLNSRINPSLKNIYTELKNEGYKPKENGDVSHWLSQGVMMLNTALTVESGKPESHLSFWVDFIKMVLERIKNETENVAWLLMGAKALAFKNFVNEAKGHVAFCTSHPSPFSANSSFRNMPAFIGSNVFKNINDFLIENNKKIIYW